MAVDANMSLLNSSCSRMIIEKTLKMVDDAVQCSRMLIFFRFAGVL